MQQELESLVRKLDRKIIVDWVEEMRLGKPAYDYLLACVRAAGLNCNQTANALHALFRLRTHGKEEDIFALCRSHANHSEIRVRSEAVKLLIGIMKLHDVQSPFESSGCVNEIKAGLALGLNHNVTALANDFLAEHGGP